MGRQSPSCGTKWSEWNKACQFFLIYILFCISLVDPKGWYLQFRWHVNSVKNLHVDYHVPLHWRCAMTGVGYLGCCVTTKDHSRVKQRNQKKVFLRTILLRRTKLKQQPLLWCLILIIKLIDNPDGTPLYKPYRYMPPQKVRFLWPLDLKNQRVYIDFGYFGLESDMVFEGTTGVYKRIYHFSSK